MSSLLSQASLVMIPSGYKEDVVYSQIPTNGNGDLSFTRASNGTRINSAGLVEVTPWNLVQQSNAFSTSPWTALSGASVTANNTTAPNGTNTGARLAVPSTAFAGFIQSIPDNTQTLSIYAKKGTLDYLWIIHENISQLGASFNLDTGVVSFVASGHNASIESVGNGWYRCILSTTNSATWDFFQFGLSNASNSASSPSGGNAFIWGAQANIGSTAKPYFPTTDRLNVPRLTYQNGGGGCPSLLLEKQSTNLVTYSEQFDNASWTKLGSSVTANSTTSPDGTQNADTNTVNSLLDEHGMSQVLTIASGFNTISVYLKSNGATDVRIGFANDDFGGMTAAQRFAYFNLSNGTVRQSISGGTTTIQNVGNGWYRCVVSQNLVSGSSSGAVQILLSQGLTTYYTGNGTDGVFIWGFQLEASSYPTSYIPTTSSSATRVADLSSTSLIQTAQTFAGDFTIFADFVPFIDSTDTNGIMILGGGSSGIGVTYKSYLWFNSNFVQLSGDNETVIINRSYSMVVNQRVKIAATRVGSTVKLFLNGAQVGASASSTLSITIRSLGWSYTLPTYQTQGKINQILLSASGASDANAISLTTI